MKMERVNGLSQFLIKRAHDGVIELMLVKVTDDILFADSIDTMQEFVKKIATRFNVSKVISGGPMLFNGCKIEQSDNGDIFMDMRVYLAGITELDITR